MNSLRSLLRRLSRDRRGSVAVMLAAGMVFFVGFGAAVVDIGYLFHVRRVLQTSADMAALAGAQDINCCSGSPGRAVTTALSYSGVAGNRNASAGLDVTMASGYPALRCFTSTGMPCSGSDSANGIVVKQQTDVPLFFAKIFGNSSMQVSVTAIAGKGGTPKPADVMVILDTTASMNSTDPSCSVAGSTRLDCAMAGFRTLLSGFSPTQNRVGLMVFPGLTSTGAAALEYDCSSTTPARSTIAAYTASPVYTVVPWRTTYQNADGTLNPNSSLVKAARGGGSGCSAGVTAYGGVGTYFADAVTTAKTYLAAQWPPGRPRRSSFCSATATPTTPPPHQADRMPAAGQSRWRAKQRPQACPSSRSPTARRPTRTRVARPTPRTRISACSTLQQMASNASMFYSDTVGGTSSCTSSAHAATDLSAIFQEIVLSLTGARLLSDNTM